MNSKYNLILSESRQRWKLERLDLLIEISSGTLFPSPLGLFQDIAMMLFPNYFRINLKLSPNHFDVQAPGQNGNDYFVVPDEWLDLVYEEVHNERLWMYDHDLTSANKEYKSKYMRACARAVCEALAEWRTFRRKPKTNQFEQRVLFKDAAEENGTLLVTNIYSNYSLELLVW